MISRTPGRPRSISVDSARRPAERPSVLLSGDAVASSHDAQGACLFHQAHLEQGRFLLAKPGGRRVGDRACRRATRSVSTIAYVAARSIGSACGKHPGGSGERQGRSLQRPNGSVEHRGSHRPFQTRGREAAPPAVRVPLGALGTLPGSDGASARRARSGGDRRRVNRYSHTGRSPDCSNSFRKSAGNGQARSYWSY
jgi:hypothetical protein